MRYAGDSRTWTRGSGVGRRSEVAVMLAVAVVVTGSTAGVASPDHAALEAELRATESAFAATMAARDLDAFAGFVAEDAVFFSGDRALRGRAAVVTAWAKLFEGPDAPFSWAPEQVVVLDSEPLGLSTGPVHDPDGRLVGTFTSIWRRGDDGWKIVFDKGCDACPAVAAAEGE